MNGALAIFASRRAISVLPTPVGPIIRMFFGVISSRSRSSSCMRRQRLRSAMATARLACCWPTMCLSSSETISRGVMFDMDSKASSRSRVQRGSVALEFFDGAVVVGVDTDVAGNGEAALDDIARAEFGAVEQCPRRRLCEGAAGADRDQVVFGLNDIAVAGNDQRCALVGDR